MVRGHPSLSAMSPFDRAHTTSYPSLIETIRLSCTVYEPLIGPPSLYLATPLAFNAPTEGLPWDDHRKRLYGGQRMAKVHSGEKYCRKVQPPE